MVDSARVVGRSPAGADQVPLKERIAAIKIKAEVAATRRGPNVIEVGTSRLGNLPDRGSRIG
jgi:hypothetical protein